MLLAGPRSVGAFGRLPAEIIQRVAILLSCMEAIALSHTCRNAYAAVNDWLVFEQIIRRSEEQRIELMIREEECAVSMWRVPEHAYASHSVCKTDVYERYALANERSYGLPFGTGLNSLNLSQWLPMLLLCDRMC